MRNELENSSKKSKKKKALLMSCGRFKTNEKPNSTTRQTHPLFTLISKTVADRTNKNKYTLENLNN